MLVARSDGAAATGTGSLVRSEDTGASASSGVPVPTITEAARAASGAAVTGWMRPDRIKFDGERAPFVVPDAESVTWYKIGEEEGATTIAAQQVKQITNYLGAVESATIGGVCIFNYLVHSWQSF